MSLNVGDSLFSFEVVL